MKWRAKLVTGLTLLVLLRCVFLEDIEKKARKMPTKHGRTLSVSCGGVREDGKSHSLTHGGSNDS